jgi:hypothetical protein
MISFRSLFLGGSRDPRTEGRRALTPIHRFHGVVPDSTGNSPSEPLLGRSRVSPEPQTQGGGHVRRVGVNRH